jgi:cell division protein FtsI (penicillin-binding protein 3)
MLGRTDSRPRLLVFLVVLVVTGSALIGRLAWWQVLQGPRLAADARRQTSIRVELPTGRGTIYDRSGTVVLATTVDRYRLIGSPKPLDPADRASTTQGLINLLGLTDATVVADLTAKMASERDYVVLTRGLDEATGARIRAALALGTLRGLSLEPEPERVYPLAGGAPGSTLAAQLMGFVNREGMGQYGIEQFYQAQLAGQPEVVLAQRDANNNPVPDTQAVVSPGVDGTDLRLTIDAGLQLALEQELLAAGIADRAKSVSAVVMDPATGEVYGEASYPSYDGNDYRTIAATDTSRFIDPVVSSVYEPGSVFKMFTALAAFEHGTATPDTPVHDTGSLSLDHGEGRIYDADRAAMGWLKFEDIVAYSRNVGAARVALGLAPSTAAASAILEGTWRKVGFGSPTGIDLAGEVPGLVRDPTIRRWSQVDLANGSFGQGVAVTPIQLATAYAAMINGGTLVTPHCVAAIGTNRVAPAGRGRVMAADTSQMLVDLMKHVLTTVPWYREKTLVAHLTMGGKTGTAQIWDPAAHHGKGAWKSTFNYSFVGFVGRERAQLVIAVQLNEATPLHVSQGNLPLSVESYELFRRIATDAMNTLDLPTTQTASATR